MRILVTGGSGYVGWHLIQEILALGHQVIIFDSVKNSTLEISVDCLFFQSKRDDLSDIHLIEKDLQIDVVIHLAAKKSVLESTRDPILFRQTNIEGSKNAARFAVNRNIPIFINASSAAVYGNDISKVINSDSLINPKSIYGETKALAEDAIREILDCNVTFFYNLRFFNIAGYASNFKLEIADINIFPKVARALLKNELFTLNGNNFDSRDGSCIRDFIHVQDVVKGILSCLHKRNLSMDFFDMNVNVCSGVGTTMLEVIRLLEEQAGYSLNLEFAPRRLEDPSEVVGDPSVFLKLIGGDRLIDIRDIATSTWKSHILMDS